MAEKRLAGTYDTSTIAVADWPPAVSVGSGWWRLHWKVEWNAGTSLTSPHLTPPPAEVGDLAFVVGLFQVGERCLLLEVLSRCEKLYSNEIGYLSLLLQELQDQLGPLRIDGHVKHPLLTMSDRTSRA